MFHVEHNITDGDKMNNINEEFMAEAVKEAKKAISNNEIPVGAVVVFQNKVVGRGYNKKELTKDPTMHAEIIALRAASKKLGDWRMNKCSIYVTMEPCAMCMGSIKEARIENVYCGIENQKSEINNKDIAKMLKLNIEYGILESEILEMTKSFFKLIRNK